jgi:hypothetical protein
MNREKYMIRKIITMAAISICLGASALCVNAGDSAQPQPGAKPGVKIQFKFTPGEVLRYKTVMETINDTGDGHPTTHWLTTVVRRTTNKVLPDGTGQLTEVMEYTKWDSMEMPVETSAVTMDVSPTGVVKNIRGTGKFAGRDASRDNNQNKYFFPESEVKVGDKWSQEYTAYIMGEATIHLDKQLISTATKINSDVVAEIKETFSGPLTPFKAGGMMKSGSGTGTGTIYFSLEKGRLIEADDNIYANVSWSVGGIGAAPHITYKVQTTLIP